MAPTDAAPGGPAPAGTAPDIRYSRRRWLVLAVLCVGAALALAVCGRVNKKRAAADSGDRGSPGGE